MTAEGVVVVFFAGVATGGLLTAWVLVLAQLVRLSQQVKGD